MKQRWAGLALLLVAVPGWAASKTARGTNGMVATSTPSATAAAVTILEQGGNAVDAAAAACFALMVTDPAMTSLGGRSQTIIALRDGRVIGVDGATQAPAGLSPPADAEPARSGYQIVPVPGNPAALNHAVARYGRLTLAQVMRPAIDLAENGFTVTPRIAEIWERERQRLAANPGASANYLKQDGTAYRAGEVFRHPRLAAVMKAIAESGVETFYRGTIAEAIMRDVGAQGGYLRLEDLSSYRPEAGVIVRTSYRGYEVVTMGRHAWGNTLAEMLNILGHFRLRRGEPTPEEAEILSRVIAQALADRPQHLGTLRPKPDGYPLDVLSSAEFARERAQAIRRQLGQRVVPARASQTEETRDTTHLSIIDGEGNAVAMTTSIGPRFGARVATPELGFLYAHSYNMRSSPAAGARDLTEMTPTIVLRSGRPVLAVGAAGSERIPGAILQVISNVIDRGYSLEKALAAPRVFCAGSNVRIHEAFPLTVGERLRRLGFALQVTDGGIDQHLGIVQAVLWDAARKQFVGAADPVYDGAAAGPAQGSPGLSFHMPRSR